MADIVDDTFGLLQKLFRQVHVPYVIIGGYAANVWGVERATLDIDLLVGGHRSRFATLIDLAARHHLQPQPQFLELNPLLRGTMVRCRIDHLHVDFLRPRDTHDRSVLRRRREHLFAGRRLWFPATEDLILMKLKVSRDRDMDDASRVAALHRQELDHGYLRRWAKKLGLQEELAYVLRSDV